MTSNLENDRPATPSTPSASNPLPSPNPQSHPDYSPQEMQALRQAISKDSIPKLALYFLDYILRAQDTIYEQIHSRQSLARIATSMAILGIVLSGIYGFTMGIQHSLLQALSSAIKLPILFSVTALFCIPSLYTFNVLLGQRFRFMQTVTLMAATLGTTTILLASIAPIALFFTLTTQDKSFLLLMHVAICGTCGVHGVRYLYRGCSYIAFRMEQPLNKFLLRMWMTIYAIVGMQLSWRLRPFVGANDNSPFVLLREHGDGNFFTAVWGAISWLLFGSAR